MRRLAGTCLVTLLVATPTLAQPPAQPAPDATPAAAAATDAERLPVKRVVLYKNGVGFFEHLGRIRGTQSVTIDFTSGQLDDALKTLTTVDLGNGRVTGVSFNTDDPASRKIGALSLPVDENTSVLAFLGALRGARVEVAAATGTIVGQILTVESRTRLEGDTSMEVRELAIVTDAGELKTVEVTPRTSVRVVDRELRGDIRRYLDILSSARQRDLRRMTIATAGTGDRQLYVSYISEVPVWKSTYRLVLPSKPGEKPLLQGWAIVDNTIGEDWSGVELSLVAGAPQSFVQHLSQPLYARRPVIPLPSAMQLSPQTHEGTLSGEGGMAGSAKFAPRMAGTVPEGVVGGMVGGLAEAPPPPPPAPAMAPAPAPAREAAMNVVARTEAAAQGRDLGDLFEYRLKEPVTIRKNQSALVPIVAAAVDAERVSVWNASTGPRPRAAMWVTNSTANTLDGGSFAVLENGTFTGEGVMEPVKAGERRLLSYAADLALLVDARPDQPEPERVTDVRIGGGVMVLKREYRDRRVYTIRNEDAKARALIIEHPNRPGWSLTGAPKPDETSPGAHRFRVPVAAKSTATLTVEESRPLESTVQLVNVSDDQITLLIRQKSLSPEAEQALKAVVAKRADIAAVAGEIRARDEEAKKIAEDQERVRENLKALGDRAEERALVSRYTRQLEEQETRLDVLKRETAEREAKRRTLQAELDKMVRGLTFGK